MRMLGKVACPGCQAENHIRFLPPPCVGHETTQFLCCICESQITVRVTRPKPKNGEAPKPGSVDIYSRVLLESQMLREMREEEEKMRAEAATKNEKTEEPVNG